MTTPTKETFLEDLPLSLAVAAFQGTSFSPEKRAASHREDYANTLLTVYQEFARHAAIGKTLDQLEAVFADFRAGFRSRYTAYLRSHAHCLSTMITGPANFPVRRAQKRNAVSDKRLHELVDFLETFKRSYIRKLRPDLRPIMAGDEDAIARMAVKLAGLELAQARMKEANATIRKSAKKGYEATIKALHDLGYSESAAQELVKPDFAGRLGFPDYRLTNNGANIRSARARLEALERAQNQPVTEATGQAGIRLEDDPPANRVRLFFDGKPDANIRAALKAHGFRWAPTIGAWQAYRNSRAIEFAQRTLKGN